MIMDQATRNPRKKREPVPQVSIKDVARIAGVSIATVSRCVNDPVRVREKTRIKVQDAILKTGYTPNTLAQSFRCGKTHVIMVILPSLRGPPGVNGSLSISSL